MKLTEIRQYKKTDPLPGIDYALKGKTGLKIMEEGINVNVDSVYGYME